MNKRSLQEVRVALQKDAGVFVCQNSESWEDVRFCGVWEVRKNQWIVTVTSTVTFSLQEIIRMIQNPFVSFCLLSRGHPRRVFLCF
jgi:hypothetical protein